MEVRSKYESPLRLEKIEIVEMRAGDIKTGFGNPRKNTWNWVYK